MIRSPLIRLGCLLAGTLLIAQQGFSQQIASQDHPADPTSDPNSQSIAHSDRALELVNAAMQRTLHSVVYDGSYRSIEYPNGDVPDNIGVCTDVVIRSYRQLGLDLQRLVHEDMSANFDQYPDDWGLSRPDSNIDHRRVPNLEVFFDRFGERLPVSQDPEDYLPGDLVSWRLDNRLPHIGIVVEQRSADGNRPMVVHNIGWGPKMEDMLFDHTIVGHYRFLPDPGEFEPQFEPVSPSLNR